MATPFSSDLGSAPVPLRHPWQHCVGSCHAITALRADWQSQLARAHRELGVRHVRFHGMLDDAMGTVICQDERYLYSFLNLDRIHDFLLGIGMRPIVELSFMPWSMASGGETVFRYRGNITPPRHLDDWTALCTRLATHWCERYGVDEVSQWPIEVWNEPNLTAFWSGGQAGYFELYRRTWEAIKAVSPRLQVGGPVTAQNAWLPEFDAFAREHGCEPDFISTHYYPTDAFGQIGADTETQLAHAPPGVMRDHAESARAIAGRRPLYYTEWNITSNPRDPLHDGAFCAALAIRLAMTVDDVVDAMAWWTFSDIFEENYLPSVPFHGGFGLLSLHDVAKPVYRGFELLRRLGPQAWAVEGRHDTLSAWVGAADDRGADAVIVNVALPQHAIASEDVELRLRLPPGRRAAAAFVSRIDESHANPRAAWQAMGEPEYPSATQVAALQVASVVVPEPWPLAEEDGLVKIALALPPNAVAGVRVEWRS